MNLELDLATVGLRTLVYVGTIAAAGGVLFALTFHCASHRMPNALAWQIRLGAVLVLLVEPLRYILFQLSISEGDWFLAFSPEMRWMALEVSNGQAAVARVLAVLLILVGGPFNRLLWICGATTAIGSYLLEGHTTSTQEPSWLSLLLFVHVAVVHWWIGALAPLATIAIKRDDRALIIARFGKLAMPLVAVLVAAGILLLGSLTHWSIDLESAYQFSFALKAGAVAFLFAIAAWNKFKLTPLFELAPKEAGRRLQASISVESVFALLVLALTALLITSSPAAP